MKSLQEITQQGIQEKNTEEGRTKKQDNTNLVEFSNKDIAEFCRITNDTNTIHNPEIMKGYGRRAIVPGMYLFAYVAARDYKFMERANFISAYFASPLSADESFVPGITSFKNSSVHILSAYAANAGVGADFLSDSKNHSALCCRRSKKYLKEVADAANFNGVERAFLIMPEDIASFARLLKKGQHTKPCNEQQGAYYTKTAYIELLFSIAYSSHALLKSIEEPISPLERALHQKLCSENNRILPVYRSFEIYLPKLPSKDLNETSGRSRCLDFSRTLDFVTAFEFDAADEKCKDITARVKCWQNPYVSGTSQDTSQDAGPDSYQEQRLIYAGSYKLTALPERVIIRAMARKL